MTAAEVREVRASPVLFFQGFGYFRDEQTRTATRGKANVLQRRGFEHYRQCQEKGVPCRMVWLKYRRAGSSTAGACLTYMHALNHRAKLGVIGTDYRASANMMQMIRFYGEHDQFPGWSIRASAARGQSAASSFETQRAKPKVSESRKVGWEEWFDGESPESVPLEDRVDRIIATKIDFSHDSEIELYTAKNPESARSAQLHGYHATEVARWPKSGVQDASETLKSMRQALPKEGFHFALEESTANGAQGEFYETCRKARWPEAEWTKQFQPGFALEEQRFGKDLQFVFIFAAWFEDERHVPKEPLSEEDRQFIEDNLDPDEKALIARFGQEGPKGLRLGGEVNATVWEQLAWRRGIIATVCTKLGTEEFKQEYPSSPDEAFRASGSPALDTEGVLALEAMTRDKSEAALPVYGQLSAQTNGSVTWSTTTQNESTITRWEEPIIPATARDRGGRYLVVCDPASGADKVTNEGGNKDRHGVFVLRDAHTDGRGKYHQLKVVARIKPPCQWEDESLTRMLVLLGIYYGHATIVVESNAGAAILKALADTDRYNYPNIYQRETFDDVRQKMTLKLGWNTSEPSRRIAIATLQRYVREQMMELRCPHAVSEMMTLIIDAKGKVKASGSLHDDDPLALSIGLECMGAAREYPAPRPVRRVDPNDREWR